MVKVMVMMKGVVHVSFIGVPRWASLLLKKVNMRSNPTMVGGF